MKIDKKNDYLLFAGVFRQKEKIISFFKELENEGCKFSSKIVLLPPKLADLVFNKLRIPVDVFIGRADVFHASNWTTPATKAKLVTTVHDLTPILYPETFPKSIINNFKTNLKLIEKNADMVLTDSLTTRKDLIERSNVKANKIKTVYLAAGQNFKPETDEGEIEKVKGKYGIKGGYILSVGTLEPRKNIKKLIKAFLSLQLITCSLQLILVGKIGWGDKKIKNKPCLPAGRNGKLNIITTGFVPDNDLPALYSGALAFVYPSFYEGFGLPVLEAMACGCPVITSNRSSTAEIAGSAGLLVNPKENIEIANAIEKIAKGEKLRKKMKANGLRQAKEFSWEKTAKNTLAAYGA